MRSNQQNNILIGLLLACTVSSGAVADLSDQTFELNELGESLVEKSLRQKVRLLLESPSDTVVTTGLELPISLNVPNEKNFALPLNDLSDGYGVQLIESIPFYDSIEFSLELLDPLQIPDCDAVVQKLISDGAVDRQTLAKVTCNAGDSDFRLQQSVSYGQGSKCEVVSGDLYQCTTTVATLEPTSFWYADDAGKVDFKAQLNTTVKSRNNIPVIKDAFVPINVSGITVFIPAKVNQWDPFKQTASSASIVDVNGISTNRGFEFGCEGYKYGLEHWLYTPVLQDNSKERLVGSYTFKKQSLNGVEINGAKLLGSKCPDGITFYGKAIASVQSQAHQSPLKLTVDLDARSDAADLVASYSDLLADMLQSSVIAFNSYQTLDSQLDGDTDAVSSHLVDLSKQIHNDIDVYLSVLQGQFPGYEFDTNSLFDEQGYFKPAVQENFQQPEWLSKIMFKGVLGFYFYNDQIFARNISKQNTINVLYTQIINQGNISPKSVVAQLIEDNNNSICQIQAKATLLLNAINDSSFTPDTAELDAIKNMINQSVEGLSCDEVSL